MRTISYERVLEGLILHTVVTYQDSQFCLDPECRHSSQVWAKKLFSLFWELIHKVWNGRNEQLHQTDQTDQIFELQGLQQVKQAITQEFQLGLHRLPACEFLMMFSS